MLDPAESLNSDEDFEEWALETYEWISLVGLGSPRVLSSDTIDTYLSRYRVPNAAAALESPRTKCMVALTWTGLLPGEWIRDLFIQIR